MDGALASWAVPKTPPAKAGIRRLAVKVPDHDASYIDFEGEIADGSYGAGTVMIWDRGTYDTESRKDCKIVFYLHGKRLTGRYTLIKMSWGKDQWIFFKTKKAKKIR
jgi:DNA ligase D-like protein (predicted 3'-phosphoesterase)